MAAEGQNGSKMLDEMPEYRIFELLKKYHYKYIFNKIGVYFKNIFYKSIISFMKMFLWVKCIQHTSKI